MKRKWCDESVYQSASSFSSTTDSPELHSKIADILADVTWTKSCFTIENWNKHYNDASKQIAISAKIANSANAVKIIRPFEGIKVANRQIGIDLFLNTSGPIWDVSFAPVPRGDESIAIERFLAVGVSRIGWMNRSQLDQLKVNTKSGLTGLGHDIPYRLGESYRSNNLLQIWKIVYGVNDDGLVTSNAKLSAEGKFLLLIFLLTRNDIYF